MRQFTIDQLLADNPGAKAHEGLVREALNLIETLREMGIEEQGYRLAPTFERNWADRTQHRPPSRALAHLVSDID